MRAGYFSVGQLTTAIRAVRVNGLLPAVDLQRRNDFDLARNLARETHLAVNGTDRTLNYEYWPDHSLKRKQLADGTWTGQYLYDVVGHLASIDNANMTSSTEPDLFVSAAQYNARGQTTSVTYGNGVTTALTYNNQRGWLNRVLTTNGAATLLDQTYARNNKGVITGITSPDASRSWTYGFDALDRLILADNGNGAVDDREFAYDDTDNMIWNSGLCAGSAVSPNLIYPTPGATAVRPMHRPASAERQSPTMPMAIQPPMMWMVRERFSPAHSLTTEKTAR